MTDEDRLRQSLRRCLAEAEGWLQEAHGCKPADVIGYDGWAEEALELLAEPKTKAPLPG